ncbi:RNA polymerase sigma-70 factor [Bacteroides sp.]|uniref:RNA polymerase sigma-70 factor n=1 Tax=Bacteroides sp. TaxID=29523 RepID=UPI001B44DCCC|nr:RNA polymerase sigma-70 factor [Bacteroides sp.]MBP6065449.1 RNA polymerase sigma-70 factor [Bacteroides sp.]MBP6936374.1 RNA polymerase sigma-70 factor [Bacteroides sp.]MBP8621802.1 RNA polymerase sigma-70 factor [Bacteroides sp.]MBP9586503.1 RNA polymerase sigma-70 factor [Bacteroides sp.]
MESVREKGIQSKKEFDLFFKKYYTLFLSFACRYQLDEDEAQDIVQDVFIAFWEQCANFTSMPAIKAFFYRSISNRCLNVLKHEDVKNRYAKIQMLEMDSEEFIHENIIREEVSFIVRQKIKLLTPREQEVPILSLQNKSNQEIADQLSLSLPTVKTHKMHAYSRLRVELEELRFLLLFV